MDGKLLRGEQGGSVAGDNRTALAVGSLLNNEGYRIEAVLGADTNAPTGRGGFGITYQALDENLGRTVAIKEFFPSDCYRVGTNLAPGGSWTEAELVENRQKFLAEGRALVGLSHPGIVRVFNIFRENATVYLVMEYLHGQTLQQRLKGVAGNRLSVTEALGYIEQAGAALMAVHAGGLLHRDIKPDNLFVRADGQLVLIDFGSARPITQDGRFRTEYAIVSKGYSPPEYHHAEGRRDSRSDIYSLAATLYRLLTGLVPNEPLVRVSVSPLISPHVIAPDVSESVSNAIMKGLELSPDARPDSVESFLKSLRPVVPRRTHNPQDGAELVYIPAGEFIMGSTQAEVDAVLAADARLKREWFNVELGQHRVYLDGYYMYKHPVTVKQYRQYCSATGKQMPPAPGFNPNWSKADHPIVNVSWEDAQGYCGWAGVGLPTEAQWEKVARGTDGRKFPWGNQWDGTRCANSVSPASLSGTVPVASYASGASPYGVLDMAGNVWEWCEDWFDEHYYKTSPKQNPKGPTTGSARVLRGGSWINNFEIIFRCANRIGITPDSWNFINGFRCVVLADSR